MKTLAVAFLALLFFPIAAHALPAPPLTGQKLLKDCTSAVPSSIMTCQTYILGIMQGARAVEAKSLGGKQIWFGGVAGVTNYQLQKVVTEYLTDFPQLLHYQADLLVLRALHRAFPPPKDHVALFRLTPVMSYQRERVRTVGL